MIGKPTTRMPRIGLLGGSFDPIHVGHLALAQSAQTALLLDQVLFLPTARSWQKPGQHTDPQHRLNMVSSAIAHQPAWQADDREIRRGGNTYTVDTLAELREELGNDVALILLLGSDQLHNLATWDRYEQILSLAHIAVTQREKVALRDFGPEIDQLLNDHGRDAIGPNPAGDIVFFRMPPAPVSSTRLRAALAHDEPVCGLIPSRALTYIQTHGLYRQP